MFSVRGMRVSVREDGDEGRPVARWLADAGVHPAEELIGCQGVVERPNAKLAVLDGWGLTSVTSVRFPGETRARLVPNPCLRIELDA